MLEPSSPGAALAGEAVDVRRAVEMVGQILLGSVNTRATLEGLVHAHLGRSGADVVCQSRNLSSIGRTVLVHGEVSRPRLISTVRSGRFRAQLPQGSYL